MTSITDDEGERHVATNSVYDNKKSYPKNKGAFSSPDFRMEILHDFTQSRAISHVWWLFQMFQ